MQNEAQLSLTTGDDADLKALDQRFAVFRRRRARARAAVLACCVAVLCLGTLYPGYGVGFLSILVLSVLFLLSLCVLRLG